MMTDRTFNAHHRLSRRRFVQSVAATTLASPLLVPASVLGAHAPSNQITLGVIGVGNKGVDILRRFMQQADCRVVAVCDVNRGSYGYRDADQFLGREPAREIVERYYAQAAASGRYQGCRVYTDFRELLAQDDIDAVAICTPDHWHAEITIQAAAAGKDIYCEKPLSLTVSDGRAMVEAVRRHNRVLQTGSHERSNPTIRRACELVRNGYLGEVRRVVTHIARNNKVGPGPGWRPMLVPDGFDYEMWLGPAPDAPYHEDRCLYRFRFIDDYSGGQVTNFGAHSIDIAHWALDLDDTGPLEVEHVYADYAASGSLFNTATHAHFRCRYAAGLELECRTAEPGVRCIFEGTEGMLRVDSGGNNFVSVPQSLTSVELKPGDVRLGNSTNHQHDFLDAVKSRRNPSAPVEVGHRTATVCHLGNIAMRMQARLRWDPASERFAGPSAKQANARLSREPRGTWVRS